MTSPLWGGEQIPATPPQNLEVMKEDKSGQTCESDKDLWFPDTNKDLSLLEWQIARMSVPKLVCEVSYASCLAWSVRVDGGLGCE